MEKPLVYLSILFMCQFLLPPSGMSREPSLEKKIIKLYKTNFDFTDLPADHCAGNQRYVVYLVDNFDEKLEIVPELTVTHGELMRTLLLSGRSDIEARILNTTLGRGLATVLDRVVAGECVDAVVSSIPGSNYSYGQVASLFSGKTSLSSRNILAYKGELLTMMANIALYGFPSVEWLKRADVNAVKLREDARKVVFIEFLARFGIPVYLPYGNQDSYHRGQPKRVNILSISENSRVFSGIGLDGEHIADFPTSPLSSGNAQAVFPVVECPDYHNSSRMNIDVNNDGHIDFSYLNRGPIPYWSKDGELSYSPPPISKNDFFRLEEEVRRRNIIPRNVETVLTREQYLQLLKNCTVCSSSVFYNEKPMVWLNSARYGKEYFFSPQCQQRGTISGTSLIPPIIIKNNFPQKRAHDEAG